MDLDDELRQLFADERLEVPVRPGADDVIVAGARRVRRRRITAVAASGALAVVAVVAAGIVLAGGNPDAMPPANRYKNSPTSTTTTTTTNSSTQPSTAQSAPQGTTGGKQNPPAAQEDEENPDPPPPTVDPPPQLDYPVLGPTGFDALQLGQSQADAEATGMVGVSTGQYGDDCSEYQLLVGGEHVGLVYFRGNGLVAIMPFTSQTPEGVGPGWTVQQAAAVYPDLDVEFALANRYAIVSVPGNSAATFRLLVDTGVDEIVRATMQTASQPCFP